MASSAMAAMKWRSKKFDLNTLPLVRILRDHTKRKVFEKYEPERQALRAVARNTTLPQRVRSIAQLQLSQMHCYTRSTQIRNRCIMGGKSRGVLRAFSLTRYNMRMLAYEGRLPGVRKANW